MIVIYTFILIAFMAIYSITSSLWHLRKLRLKGERILRHHAKRTKQCQANRYQRYLRSHNAWINRLYHEMFNEEAEKRTLDSFEYS